MIIDAHSIRLVDVERAMRGRPGGQGPCIRLGNTAGPAREVVAGLAITRQGRVDSLLDLHDGVCLDVQRIRRDSQTNGSTTPRGSTRSGTRRSPPSRSTSRPLAPATP